MRFRSILSGAAVIVISAAGHTAWGADDTAKQCVADAAAEYKATRTAAQEVFKADKDKCRSLDPVCADACRTTHKDCVAVPEAAIEACKELCATTLKEERDTTCKALPEDSAERVSCIDTAQLVAFTCRDNCRDNADRAALRTCKTGFKTCIQTCAVSAPAP